MRASALAAMVRFNGPNEGVEPFLYTDSLGKVTCAMGHLCDSVEAATGLGWVNPDGSPADAATIESAWTTVKNAWPAVSSVNCASLTAIRLPAAAINAITAGDVARFETTIRQYVPAYDSWPADAQMAIMSMSWAMGAGFLPGFPQFMAAVNASPPQFSRAAPPEALGHFKDAGGGITQRLAWNDLCWNNAQAVIDEGLDPEVLYWPNPAPTSGSWLPPHAFGLVAALGVTGASGAALLYPERAQALWAQLATMAKGLLR